MSPKDLANDLSAGLIRQWVESRGTLTAEDFLSLRDHLSGADDALQDRVTVVIDAHVTGEEWVRLKQMMEEALVRRGERS